MIKVGKNKHQTVGVRKFKAKGTSKVIKLPSDRPGWDWWYRVLKPGGGWLSSISGLRSLNLKVGNITDLSVSAPQSRGLELQWTPSPNAQQYRVAVATNPSMSGAATYTITTSAGRYAPPNLTYGVQYYFTVQALNRSSSSNVASASGVSYSRMTRVVAGSFNLARDTPGFKMTSSRLDLLASEIRRGGFDVVGLQEANTEVSKQLLARLGEYLKTTQIGPNGYNETAGQIFYKPSELRPTSTKGILFLTGGRATSYQLFEKVSNGAQFFVVTSHLENGHTMALSNLRRTQTQEIINRIRALNPSGLPTFFVGDYNSHHGLYKTSYDAPYQTMSNSRITDSVDATSNRINYNINSFNGLEAKPKTGAYHADHIFTSGGIVALEWQVLLRISGGRYITPFASDHNPVRLIAEIPF